MKYLFTAYCWIYADLEIFGKIVCWRRLLPRQEFIKNWKEPFLEFFILHIFIWDITE